MENTAAVKILSEFGNPNRKALDAELIRRIGQRFEHQPGRHDRYESVG